MPKTTLIINLGDEGEGPGHDFYKSSRDRREKSRIALQEEKAKRRRDRTLTKPELTKLKLIAGRPIHGVDAITAYRDYLQNDLATEAVRGLQRLVTGAEKIVLISHGGPIDTEGVVYKQADGSVLEISGPTLLALCPP